MKNIWIIISILLIILIFIYAINDLSNKNICSWVRIFDCQKNETLIESAKILELKNISDLFLKQCISNITMNDNMYIINYSNCNLKVNILKDKFAVDSVEVNWINLTRDEINNNLK